MIWDYPAIPCAVDSWRIRREGFLLVIPKYPSSPFLGQASGTADTGKGAQG